MLLTSYGGSSDNLDVTKIIVSDGSCFGLAAVNERMSAFTLTVNLWSEAF